MDPHQAALVETAARLGIRTRDVSDDRDGRRVLYSRGARSEVVVDGRAFSHLGSRAEFLARETHAAKEVLADLSIPTPAGIRVRDLEAKRATIEGWLASRPGPQVLKPAVALGGEGACRGIRSYEDVLRGCPRVRDAHSAYVIEDEVPGHDVRLQVLAGRIVAACRREPAQVVGDGRRNVEQLVDLRQELLADIHPQARLQLDDEADRLLARQGLSRASVPEPEVHVILGRSTDPDLGGTAVDVTDSLHPRYASWAEAIGESFGLRLFGIDVITPAHRDDPALHAFVLGVCARPAWLVHTYSERRAHDLPAMILRDLFSMHETA
jgi:cyanophycin synthetase